MSGIDIVILLVIVAGIVRGAMRGVIKQITSVAAFICAIIITHLFGNAATEILNAIVPELSKMSGGAVASSFIAHIVLFGLVYLSISLLGSTIKALAKTIMLGGADKILGAIFCSLKYLLILSAILNLWHFIYPTSEVFTSSALIGGRLLTFTLDLAPWLIDSQLIPAAGKAIESVS